MKRIICLFLSVVILSMQTGVCLAVQESGNSTKSVIKPTAKPIVYNQNARTITYAFVVDGPSEANQRIINEFKKSIIATTAPDFRATFPKEYIFTGDWSIAGAQKASDKALASNATMVVSLGYLSTKYFNNMKNKKKFVVTIDQYGLKELGGDFFNPVQQSAKGVLVFKRLVPFNKAAVLMTDSYYKTRSNWDEYAKDKLPGINFTVIPANGSSESALSKIPADCDAVIFTPLYKMSTENKKALIAELNSRKIPTYSTVGREDVELGVLYGASSYDVDKKLAETASISIKGILNGQKNYNSKISFFEEQILFVNLDTAEQIGHEPHTRVLVDTSVETISHKKVPLYDLSTIFSQLFDRNLNINRSALLVKAARRASVAAMLRYLPSFGVTVGYQTYNEDYADSAKLLLPEKTGIFTMGMEQVIYSPELVTNILIKNKKVDFSKAEKVLEEQNMGIDVALLYIDTLIVKNMLDIQKEYVTESRENLAIARVRENMGKCGKEEELRWAAQLSQNEKQLVELNTTMKNLKININKLLNKDQHEKFDLKELTVQDPAFYLSEIPLIDYLTTQESLDRFTDLVVDEAFRVAPELAKLRAAIKMKKYEMGMYYQKFVLPNAKLSVDYTSLIDAQYAGDMQLYQPNGKGGHSLVSLNHPDSTNLKFGIYAQWKPIEGGTKVAEIARCKAELDELKLHEAEVKLLLEQQIREIINRAISAYITVGKKYKTMYAAKENYQLVKKRYLEQHMSIAQVIDAEKMYLDSKVDAINSQYVFFKELIWLQRGICSVDWSHANPDAKKFIQRIKQELPQHKDIQLL